MPQHEPINDEAATAELPPPEPIGSVVSLYQCIKSVANPIGLTRTLGLFKMRGYCTGNSAAIFEVLTDDGRHLRLKCYTRPKPNLTAIYGDRLLKDELYVFTGDGGVWVDVVADEWIEGVTLSDAVRSAAAEGDRERLAALADAFDCMAVGMLARDWAHGDLKPDNIIAAPDGGLHLIDFDAVYIPELRLCRSSELGTAAWQHPSRSYTDYDRHLDDYPIALISTLLHALAVDPSMFGRYADADETVLDSRSIAAGDCPALDEAERMFAERCMAVQYRVARLLRQRAYILPQLAEYLAYGGWEMPGQDAAAVCGGRPELVMRGGLYGYECNGRMVVPPLFDDAAGLHDGELRVVLGGVSHAIRVECAGGRSQKEAAVLLNRT